MSIILTVVIESCDKCCHSYEQKGFCYQRWLECGHASLKKKHHEKHLHKPYKMPKWCPLKYGATY